MEPKGKWPILFSSPNINFSGFTRLSSSMGIYGLEAKVLLNQEAKYWRFLNV